MEEREKKDIPQEDCCLKARSAEPASYLGIAKTFGRNLRVLSLRPVPAAELILANRVVNKH